MANEIEAFNPHRFADQIKDKIRLDMLDLMPLEQRQALIEKAIRDFITPEPDRYGSRRLSPLTTVVHDLLTKEVQDMVRETLKSPEFRPQWDGMRNQAGEAIQKFLRENAAEVIGVWLQSAFQNAVSSMSIR